MKSKELPENIKKILNKITAYAIWALIIILSFSLIKNISAASQIKSDIAGEEAKIKKMQEDNDKLAAEIAETQSQNFIEKQIRDKLGLVREGEAIVVLPDEETLKKLAPQIPEEKDSLPDPNWKKWLKLFM